MWRTRSSADIQFSNIAQRQQQQQQHSGGQQHHSRVDRCTTLITHPEGISSAPDVTHHQQSIRNSGDEQGDDSRDASDDDDLVITFYKTPANPYVTPNAFQTTQDTNENIQSQHQTTRHAAGSHALREDPGSDRVDTPSTPLYVTIPIQEIRMPISTSGGVIIPTSTLLHGFTALFHISTPSPLLYAWLRQGGRVVMDPTRNTPNMFHAAPEFIQHDVIKSRLFIAQRGLPIRSPVSMAEHPLPIETGAGKTPRLLVFARAMTPSLHRLHAVGYPIYHLSAITALLTSPPTQVRSLAGDYLRKYQLIQPLQQPSLSSPLSPLSPQRRQQQQEQAEEEEEDHDQEQEQDQQPPLSDSQEPLPPIAMDDLPLASIDPQCEEHTDLDRDDMGESETDGIDDNTTNVINQQGMSSPQQTKTKTLGSTRFSDQNTPPSSPLTPSKASRSSTQDPTGAMSPRTPPRMGTRGTPLTRSPFLSLHRTPEIIPASPRLKNVQTSTAQSWISPSKGGDSVKPRPRTATPYHFRRAMSHVVHPNVDNVDDSPPDDDFLQDNPFDDDDMEDISSNGDDGYSQAGNAVKHHAVDDIHGDGRHEYEYEYDYDHEDEDDDHLFDSSPPHSPSNRAVSLPPTSPPYQQLSSDKGIAARREPKINTSTKKGSHTTPPRPNHRLKASRPTSSYIQISSSSSSSSPSSSSSSSSSSSPASPPSPPPRPALPLLLTPEDRQDILESLTKESLASQSFYSIPKLLSGQSPVPVSIIRQIILFSGPHQPLAKPASHPRSTNHQDRPSAKRKRDNTPHDHQDDIDDDTNNEISHITIPILPLSIEDMSHIVDSIHLNGDPWERKRKIRLEVLSSLTFLLEQQVAQRPSDSFQDGVQEVSDMLDTDSTPQQESAMSFVQFTSWSMVNAHVLNQIIFLPFCTSRVAARLVHDFQLTYAESISELYAYILDKIQKKWLRGPPKSILKRSSSLPLSPSSTPECSPQTSPTNSRTAKDGKVVRFSLENQVKLHTPDVENDSKSPDDASSVSDGIGSPVVHDDSMDPRRDDAHHDDVLPIPIRHGHAHGIQSLLHPRLHRHGKTAVLSSQMMLIGSSNDYTSQAALHQGHPRHGPQRSFKALHSNLATGLYTPPDFLRSPMGVSRTPDSEADEPSPGRAIRPKKKKRPLS